MSSDWEWFEWICCDSRSLNGSGLIMCTCMEWKSVGCVLFWLWGLWQGVFLLFSKCNITTVFLSLSLPLVQCGSGTCSVESVWRSQSAWAGSETGQDTDQWLRHPVPCDHRGPSTWLPAWHGKTGGRLTSYIQQLDTRTSSLCNDFREEKTIDLYIYLKLNVKHIWHEHTHTHINMYINMCVSDMVCYTYLSEFTLDFLIVWSGSYKFHHIFIFNHGLTRRAYML